MSSTITTHLWFGRDGRTCAGWIHAPASLAGRASVVICAPIGREETGARSTLRTLADRIAAAGLVALRFDYSGTGDSADAVDGAALDDQLPEWQASVDDAVDALRTYAPGPVTLLGMRIGALLALEAAVRDPSIASLVLWDPCKSGAAYLREQAALYSMAFGRPAPADGPVVMPGLTLTAATARSLSRLDVADGLSRYPGPGLLLARKGRLQSVGSGRPDAAVPLEIDEAIGQEELLNVDPLIHKVPESTIVRIVDWLDLSAPRPATRVVLPDQRQVAVARTATGEEVLERAVTFGENGLFGIVTEPGSRSPSAPAAVFWNVGRDSHVGPGRLWVELARSWASLGVASIRFDLNGLGDSPTLDGRRPGIARPPEAMDEAFAASQTISSADPTQVVLVGLCSGAYEALECGLAWRPAGICAINPIISFTPPELEWGPVDPRRRIWRPKAPSLGVSSDGRLAFARRFAARFVWRVRNALGGRRSSAWLAELMDSGVDTLIVCGTGEARPIAQGTGRMLRRLSSTGAFRLELLPDLDHGLLRAGEKRRIGEMLTAHLAAQLGPGAHLEARVDRAV